MNTSEEFEKAIELVGSCKSSVSSGCSVDQSQCDWLYARCRDYLKAYVERFGNY